VNFLRDYIRRYWSILHHADFKDPAFSLLVLLEKAEQVWYRPVSQKGEGYEQTNEHEAETKLA
jgi:hypothetical protein